VGYLHQPCENGRGRKGQSEAVPHFRLRIARSRLGCLSAAPDRIRRRDRVSDPRAPSRASACATGLQECPSLPAASMATAITAKGSSLAIREAFAAPTLARVRLWRVRLRDLPIHAPSMLGVLLRANTGIESNSDAREAVVAHRSSFEASNRLQHELGWTYHR